MLKLIKIIANFIVSSVENSVEIVLIVVVVSREGHNYPASLGGVCAKLSRGFHNQRERQTMRARAEAKLDPTFY